MPAKSDSADVIQSPLKSLSGMSFIELSSCGALDHELGSRLERLKRFLVAVEGLVLPFVASKVWIFELGHELVIGAGSRDQYMWSNPSSLTDDQIQLGPRM